MTNTVDDSLPPCLMEGKAHSSAFRAPVAFSYSVWLAATFKQTQQKTSAAPTIWAHNAGDNRGVELCEGVCLLTAVERAVRKRMRMRCGGYFLGALVC